MDEGKQPDIDLTIEKLQTARKGRKTRKCLDKFLNFPFLNLIFTFYVFKMIISDCFHKKWVKNIVG